MKKKIKMSAPLSEQTVQEIVQEALKISMAQCLSTTSTNTAMAINNTVVLIERIDKEQFEEIEYEVRTQLKRFLSLAIKSYPHVKEASLIVNQQI